MVRIKFQHKNKPNPLARQPIETGGAEFNENAALYQHHVQYHHHHLHQDRDLNFDTPNKTIVSTALAPGLDTV